MSKERYLQNRARVYEIYGIPIKDRGTRCDMHHIVNKKDLGVLVPRDFDIDAKSNLYPLCKEVHAELTVHTDQLDQYCDFRPRVHHHRTHHRRHHK